MDINRVPSGVFSSMIAEVANQGKNTSGTVYILEQYSLEMSSSWNFPARASPSYEGSEPSRAELGRFNFQAEKRAEIFLRTTIKFPNFLPVL